MDEIAELEAYLIRGAHSFRMIRRRTALRLSDDDFRELIRLYPEIFRRASIVRRDREGRTPLAQIPGIALTGPSKRRRPCSDRARFRGASHDSPPSGPRGRVRSERGPG